MQFAKKGDHERYLADANLFMEFLSHIVISWLWLDMAVLSKQCILNNDKNYSIDFYKSKVHTMKFYFKYELPKTESLANTLMSNDTLTINDDDSFLF